MRHSICAVALDSWFSRYRALAVSSLVVAWLVVLVTVSAAQDSQQQIAGHLESGEFGPALALANGVNNPDLRDQLLADIAQAQFRAGVRNGSFATASQISGDQSRSGLLAGFSQQRLQTSPNTKRALSGRGGGVVADFEPLMELIQSTIAPDTWEDAGGTGAMSEFRTGVEVDPSGTLKRIASTARSPRLDDLRSSALLASENENVRKPSKLRKVSITRLEKELQLRIARGLPADEPMEMLAGIYEINYLLVYPESGDIVIAGPAGEWIVDDEGRRVNKETGKPCLKLDDLVVCLRNALEGDGRFGCSITPRKDNLAKTKQFLASTKLKGEAWRNGIRDVLGRQDIEVSGIDPQTSTARTLVEADYRMKLVGMGLEEGVPGVKSYLDMVTLDKDGNPPPMDVARWWFTMNYEGVIATDARDAFEMQGTGVRVLAEQEMIDDVGKRIHTGKADGPTLEFALSFTRNFKELAVKYPIYAELKNVFDFALVAALIRSENLADKTNWHMTYFGTPKDANQFSYSPSLSHAPTEVASVMNHRIIEVRKGRSKLLHTIVGVSGGVSVNSREVIEKESKADTTGIVKTSRTAAQPQNLQHNAWWWD